MVTFGFPPPIIGCLIGPFRIIGEARTMELAQGILLPVLVAAVVANTVLLLLIVVVTRRRAQVSQATTQSALQGSLLSTSYVDHSAEAFLSSGGESAFAEAAGAGDAPDDAAGANAVAADPDGDAEFEAALAVQAGEPATDGEPNIGIDALTGLIGPGGFTRLVAAEDARVRRYHHPATVVIFELVGLDRLMDRLGTDAADRIVPALADTMGRLARDTDQVARLAPGRFGVLLPETDEIAAINYVERVRRACELWLESGAIALSLAVGWAGTTGDPSLPEAQRLATDRMYAELRREARRAADG
jgi:diguanylate cyclase (GGDEF)-like protein